jgi:hypothetical protein
MYQRFNSHEMLRMYVICLRSAMAVIFCHWRCTLKMQIFHLLKNSLLGKLLKTSGLKIYIHAVMYHTSHVIKMHRYNWLPCHYRQWLLPWVGECSFFYCKEQIPVLCVRAFRVGPPEGNNLMLETSRCPFGFCLYHSPPLFRLHIWIRYANLWEIVSN